MRFSVDSNVLVYSFLRDDERKHQIASDLMIRAMLLDCVLAAQTIAEFLNVIRRKRVDLFGEARAQARRWCETIKILDTAGEDVIRGADFSAKHRLQLWDSIIWQVVQRAHSVLFISEDLQDQLSIDGMKALNPFSTANEAELRHLLSSTDDEIAW